MLTDIIPGDKNILKLDNGECFMLLNLKQFYIGRLARVSYSFTDSIHNVTKIYVTLKSNAMTFLSHS